MKTYKKGEFFFLEFPEDILEEYDEELEQILANTLTLNKYNVVADLASTRYLSTHTIRLIIKFHKGLEGAGKVFCVINAAEDILKLFEFTNLNKVLHLYPSENEMFSDLKHKAPPPEEAQKLPAQEAFTYTLQDIGACTLVRMNGYIRNINEMKRFEEDVVRIVKGKKYNFVFNIEKITFIDSLGIGRFVKLQSFLKAKGGKVIFCCANDLVADFFNILGLNDRFLLFNTEEEALRHYQG